LADVARRYMQRAEGGTELIMADTPSITTERRAKATRRRSSPRMSSSAATVARTGHRRGSCAARGSEDLRDYMKVRAKELGLAKVRVNQAGLPGPVRVWADDGDLP
jgi:hypothetical protein